MRYFIYFLVKSEKVVYVGHTRKIHVRLKGHKIQDFDYVRWIVTYGKESALFYEKRWIKRFRPTFNTYGVKEPKVINKKPKIHGASVSKSGKSYRVSISITEKEYDEAVAMAKQQERTLGNYLSYCLIRGLINDKYIKYSFDEESFEMKIAL